MSISSITASQIYNGRPITIYGTRHKTHGWISTKMWASLGHLKQAHHGNMSDYEIIKYTLRVENKEILSETA